jgi:hypothetical protein
VATFSELDPKTHQNLIIGAANALMRSAERKVSKEHPRVPLCDIEVSRYLFVRRALIAYESKDVVEALSTSACAIAFYYPMASSVTYP